MHFLLHLDLSVKTTAQNASFGEDVWFGYWLVFVAVNYPTRTLARAYIPYCM